MRIGIHHGQAFPETGTGRGPIAQSLRLIAEDDFFDSVSVPAIDDPTTRNEVCELLRSSGLVPSYTIGGAQLSRGHNLGALNEHERAPAIAAAKRWADEAAELGADQLQLVAGPDPGQASRENALQQLERSLDEICAYVNGTGLTVVMDIIDRSVQRRGLVGSTADAVRVARALQTQHRNFGLTVDLSHLPMLGETIDESLSQAGPFLANVHIGNCYLADPASPAYGDAHPRFGYPGSLIRVIELAQFLAGLERIGYISPGGRSVVAFNVRPQLGEAPTALIANSKRALRDAWRVLSNGSHDRAEIAWS